MVFIFLYKLIVITLTIILLLNLGKRYKHNHGVDVPDGFEETNEVMLDPKDHVKYRVYFNPKTGERFYHKKD